MPKTGLRVPLCVADDCLDGKKNPSLGEFPGDVCVELPTLLESRVCAKLCIMSGIGESVDFGPPSAAAASPTAP